MPKSAAFARIHDEVMRCAHAIPRGKVSTFAAIGQFLDVVPRQVAYLLARKNDVAREDAPWHRVVADDGSLGRPKYDARGRTQRELLEADGVEVAADGRVVGFARKLWRPTARTTGVTPTPRMTVRATPRPAAAPATSRSPAPPRATRPRR